MNARVPSRHEEVRSWVRQLYEAVEALERLFPGRHFTPDGHLIGSLGECLVADAYGLELLTASNKGYDALSSCGKRVEIKTTQAGSVAFRSAPEHALVIKLFPNATFKEIYNGPGALVWQQFENRKRPSNGQFQISLTRLRALQGRVDEAERLPRLV